MKITEHLKLKKPDLTDYVNVGDLNENMDTIDLELKKQSDESIRHTSDIENPHKVTKGQIGLGSVQNYAVASQTEAESGTNNAKYMTPLRTAQAIEELASGATSQTFLTSGVFTVPNGVSTIYVTACGGGGGGYQHNYGRGGGGGACVIRQIYQVTPKSKITVTVGSGGDRGVPGTPTILSGVVTLPGGGAAYNDSGHKPGLSGGPGGGNGGKNESDPGEPGAGGLGGGYGYGSYGNSSGGGGSYGGGGGGGSASSERPGKGGLPNYSAYSNGGPGHDGTSKGGNGAYGAGGGGGSGNGSGGTGGNGIVIIEW